MTVPISVVSRAVTGQDSYGNDVYGSVTVTEEGLFAPGGSVENVASGDMVTTQPTVYLPLPAPVAVDRVTIGVEVFDVDGQPETWPANPYTGRRPPLPVVVRLKRVTG